jgi:hypothetical protein
VSVFCQPVMTFGSLAGLQWLLHFCRLKAPSIDVAKWLRGLGLEQYVPAFRDNDIDGDVLRSMTANDLYELGVAIGRAPSPSAGRRRPPDAIARLADRQQLAEDSPVPSVATPPPANP